MLNISVYNCAPKDIICNSQKLELRHKSMRYTLLHYPVTEMTLPNRTMSNRSQVSMGHRILLNPVCINFEKRHTNLCLGSQGKLFKL